MFSYDSISFRHHRLSINHSHSVLTTNYKGWRLSQSKIYKIPYLCKQLSNLPVVHGELVHLRPYGFHCPGGKLFIRYQCWFKVSGPASKRTRFCKVHQLSLSCITFVIHLWFFKKKEKKFVISKIISKYSFHIIPTEALNALQSRAKGSSCWLSALKTLVESCKSMDEVLRSKFAGKWLF